QEGVALEDDQVTSAHKLAAWGDYNNDGFLDLVVKDGIGPGLATGDSNMGRHYLFKNTGNSNHFIKLNLQGVQSNRHGIGARVTVLHDGQIAFRENNGGGGGEWASQGAGPLHFGIGSGSQATVTVNWPSGIVDTLSAVNANSTITIVEGSSNPTPTPTPTPTATPTPTPSPSPPSITQQPRNRVVTVGQTATFQVQAVGTPPLTYQWKKNGAKIQGARNATYITPPATAGDNGSLFAVVVSNSAGSVTSRNAQLIVNASSGRPSGGTAKLRGMGRAPL
ncbi:MAG: ASPIC/UnbV domain-containing protein, partial [Chthoniobacterales bacterium]